MKLVNNLCIKVKGDYYYIINNKRYRIISKRILKSWNFSNIANVTEADVAPYKIAGKLGFRSGSIIRDVSNNCYYYIEGSARRKITNPDFFIKLGISPDHAILVSRKEAEIHSLGEEIS